MHAQAKQILKSEDAESIGQPSAYAPMQVAVNLALIPPPSATELLPKEVLCCDLATD